MNLPNYFLADLPAEATPSAAMLTDACRTLRNNRERYLARRPTGHIIHLLVSVSRQWLDPEYPFRKLLIENAPESGFSRGTLLAGLDNFFRQITPEAFEALLNQDLGHTQRLDGLAVSAWDEKAGRSVAATGPELLLHLSTGPVPTVTLTNMLLGFLVRSAQFVRTGAGNSLVPRLFAHSLYHADPKLGACLEVAEWQGTRTDLEEALVSEAEAVLASGSDQGLQNLRQQIAPPARFIPHRHLVSFGFVSRRVLGGFAVSRMMSRVATDIVTWNQLGNLAPHVIYVETGGEVTPEQFAEKLAVELQAREEIEPRGPLRPELERAIASRRSVYQLRAADSPSTRIWCSPDSTSWTVVYEHDARFQVSCLYRFVYVKPVSDLEETLQGADAVRTRVCTVGVAAPEDEMPIMARRLAHWGALRICPLGHMQHPGLAARTDGHPALSCLVRFTEWEL